MATKTKSEIADLVLENIGVKVIGQSSAAKDGQLAEAAIDTALDQLKKRGVVNYASSAVPEWAQLPLRDYVSFELAMSYGVSGERLQMLAANRQRALAEMHAQLESGVQRPHAQPDYF